MGAEIGGIVNRLSVPAGQTPYELARALPELWKLREKLDIEALGKPKGTREKNMAVDAFEAAQWRTMAIQELILETPAAGLADAAAHLLCAYSELDAHKEDNSIAAVRRALLSSFFAVAQAAGVEPREIGFEFLAPYASIPGQIIEALAEHESVTKEPG